MHITTVSEYCQKRGVSRQFIYEYVRKGKFELVELPIFVELDGQKFNIGNQKLLKVPDIFAPKAQDNRVLVEVENQAENLTEHHILQGYYDQYLKLSDIQKRKELKQKLYADIESRPEDERKMLFAAIDEANIRLMQRMTAVNKEVQNVMALSKKQTAELELAVEQTYQEENLVDHEIVMKRYEKWLK